MSKAPNQRLNNMSKRSLLGYDDPDGEELVKKTHEQIKAQNEAKLRQLAGTWRCGCSSCALILLAQRARSC